MSYSNETANLHLPQWSGSDKPTYLVDQNGAYDKIDDFAGETNDALQQLDNELDTIAGRVTTVENKQSTDEDNIAGLQSQVGAIQTTVGSIAGVIDNLVHDINEVQSNMDTLEGAVDTLTDTTIPAIQSQATATENQLSSDGTAQGTKFYFDIKNGVAGYNTSAARGADTFNPFKSGTEVQGIIPSDIAIPYDSIEILVDTLQPINTQTKGDSLHITGYRINIDKINTSLKARGIFKEELTNETLAKMMSGYTARQAFVPSSETNPYYYLCILNVLLFNINGRIPVTAYYSSSSGATQTILNELITNRSSGTSSQSIDTFRNEDNRLFDGSNAETLSIMSNDYTYIYVFNFDNSPLALKLMNLYLGTSSTSPTNLTAESFSLNPTGLIIGATTKEPLKTQADMDTLINSFISSTVGKISLPAMNYPIRPDSELYKYLPSTLFIATYNGTLTGDYEYLNSIYKNFIQTYINM